MIRLLFLLLAAASGLAYLNGPEMGPLGSQSVPQRNLILWTSDWSPDGRYYAVGGGDHTVRIYNAQTYKLSDTLKLNGVVQALDWNADGKLLAIASDGQPVVLYQAETRKVRTLTGLQASRALAWKGDGKLLAVGDYDGMLHLYDKAGKRVTSIKKENTKGYLSVDWHPTKDLILTGSDRIRIFDPSGKMLRNIRHRKEETIILAVKWHPGGTFFATGDYGHKEEGIGSVLQYWKEDGTLIKTLRGSNAEYRNIRWNKEGTLLATASDGLRLWSKDGQVAYRGETGNLLWGVDWDPSGKKLVTSSENGKVLIWNAQAKLITTVR